MYLATKKCASCNRPIASQRPIAAESKRIFTFCALDTKKKGSRASPGTEAEPTRLPIERLVEKISGDTSRTDYLRRVSPLQNSKRTLSISALAGASFQTALHRNWKRSENATISTMVGGFVLHVRRKGAHTE